MRRGFYFRLAAEGISKNRKFYFPYILTCICMVMMFYIVAYLAMSADFSGVFGGDMLQSMLGFGVFVIGIFSLIFLYYTNSFLIRRRQKEFGLYNILGMGKRNLVKILLWENILTAVVSIAAGLAFGILFSKLAEMAAVKILGGKTGFDMHVAAKPVIWTVVLFLAITLLIMLRMVVSIFRLRPVEMLRSENTGEKPPKANWLLAILGAALLGAAYYLAVAVLDPMAAMVLFFLAVVMVILATYFLFIAGSVALCRLLQKNKRYYYKTKHFISLSSMTYRMKRNGAGLASICILSTMVLVTVSSTTCLFAQSEDAVGKRYPKDVSVQISFADQTALSEEDTEPYISAVEEILDEHGETAENLEDFRMYSLSVYQFGADFLIDLNNGEQSGQADQRDAAGLAAETPVPEHGKEEDGHAQQDDPVELPFHGLVNAVELDAHDREGQEHEPTGSQKGFCKILHHDWLHLLHFRFAEDAVGTEDEDEDEQGKGQGILIVARQVAGGHALGDTQHKAAHHGTGDGTDAAEYRGREGLEAGQEADAEVDLSHVGGDEHAAQGRQGRADDEGERDDAVGIDAQQQGHLAVLRGGAHGLAHAGIADEQAQGDHGQRAGDEDQEITGAHDVAQVIQKLHLRQQAGEGDIVRGLRQQHIVL